MCVYIENARLLPPEQRTRGDRVVLWMCVSTLLWAMFYVPKVQNLEASGRLWSSFRNLDGMGGFGLYWREQDWIIIP